MEAQHNPTHLPRLLALPMLASGTVVNISMSVAKFDGFEDLEDHVVDHLASVTDLKVFWSTIEFLQGLQAQRHGTVSPTSAKGNHSKLCWLGFQHPAGGKFQLTGHAGPVSAWWARAQGREQAQRPKLWGH